MLLTLIDVSSDLLYIHRSYFAQAIRQNPIDPFKHKYAPSVYAVITSARTVCQHIHGLYAKHRRIVRHGWYFWTAVYSSCVSRASNDQYGSFLTWLQIVLSAVVVECPGFSLARECYVDLKEALALYEEGSRPCRSEASLVRSTHYLTSTVSDFFAETHAKACGEGGTIPGGTSSRSWAGQTTNRSIRTRCPGCSWWPQIPHRTQI